jgi:hypothetical protein
MVQTAKQPVFKITPSIKKEFVKIIDIFVDKESAISYIDHCAYERS